MQPWELHPDLSADRLLLIARVARTVWRRAGKSFKSDLGDTLWGFGCKFNERMRFALVEASANAPWLRPILKNLHFVFAIGAVPARFYRGSASRPKKNLLRRSTPEKAQQSLAFPGLAAETAWIYRFAVDVNDARAMPTVSLVQHDANTGEVGATWPLTRKALRPQRLEVAAKSAEPTVPALRPAVDVAAPKVVRKTKKRSAAANDH